MRWRVEVEVEVDVLAEDARAAELAAFMYALPTEPCAEVPRYAASHGEAELVVEHEFAGGGFACGYRDECQVLIGGGPGSEVYRCGHRRGVHL